MNLKDSYIHGGTANSKGVVKDIERSGNNLLVSYADTSSQTKSVSILGTQIGTSTVGSSNIPIYLNGGSPTAVSTLDTSKIHGLYSGKTNTNDTPGHWTTTIDGVPSQLYDGLTIHLKLATSYYANGEKYNTLNVNGSGDKLVWFRYNSIATTHFGKDAELILTYRETAGSYTVSTSTGALTSGTTHTNGWILNYAYNSTNTTDLYDAKTYKVGDTDILAYNPIGEDKDGLLVPMLTKPFLVGGPMYIRSGALAKNTTGSGASLYHSTIAQIRNGANYIDGTPYSPVYLKGTISDGLFTTDTTTPYVFVLPTTDDNTYYYYIGEITTGTVGNPAKYTYVSIKDGFHPIYVRRNGELLTYSGYSKYSQNASYATSAGSATTATSSGSFNGGLYVGDNGNITEDSAQNTNGDVYLTLKNGSTYYKHQITGGTGIKVTSDSNGAITITNTSTNSDVKVTQNKVDDSQAYRLLFKNSVSDTNETAISKYSSNLTFNPQAGKLQLKGISDFDYLTITNTNLDITKANNDVSENKWLAPYSFVDKNGKVLSALATTVYSNGNIITRFLGYNSPTSGNQYYGSLDMTVSKTGVVDWSLGATDSRKIATSKSNFRTAIGAGIVESLSIVNNSLRWTEKGGTNHDLTIPYSTNSDYASYIWHDIAVFGTVTSKYEYSENGSSWTEGQIADIRDLFDHKDTSFNLASHKYIRITFSPINCSNIKYIIFQAKYADPSLSGTETYKVEFSSDNSTWTSFANPAQLNCIANYQVVDLGTSVGGNTHMRITFTQTGSGTSYPLCTIKLLTYRLGNQGLDYKDYPFTWDNQGRATVYQSSYSDYAKRIRTIKNTSNASYYLTFVDTNNDTESYELVYTSANMSFNPSTGALTVNGALTLNGNLNFSGTDHIVWNSGDYYQRIFVTDDSTNNTAVFTFQQSSNTGSSWTDLFTIKDNNTALLGTNTVLHTGNKTTTISSSSTDAQIPTALAVYNAINNGFATNDALVYAGMVNGSATSPGTFFPTSALPAGSKGKVWKVAQSGYINGVAVEIGDMIICNSDSAIAVSTSSNYSTINANFDYIQTNLDPTQYVTILGNQHILGEKTIDVLNVGQLSVTGLAQFTNTINGDINGNAATANKLKNARTISLTGAVTGSGSFDGSGNLSINTTTNVNTNVTSYLRVGSSGTTSNATSSDVSNPYLSLVEGTAQSSQVQLKGGGVTTVSAINGIVTISSTDRYVDSASFAMDVDNGIKMTLTRAGSDTATVTGTISQIASTTGRGLTPKLVAASTDTIATQASEYVLTFKSGTDTTPVWRKLPANAYNDHTYTVNNGTYSIKTKVGTSDAVVVSDFTANQSSADDITFIQGSNITLTSDVTNRTITIASTANPTWTSNSSDAAYPIGFCTTASPTSGSRYNDYYNTIFTFNPGTKSMKIDGCTQQYDSTNKCLKFIFT